MSFDEIVLSKDEMKLLKILNKQGPILIEPHNRDIIHRLEHFGLAESYLITDPETSDEMRRKSGAIVPQAAFITDIGKDYLAYRAEKEADSRKGFRRDVLLTLIGAIIGSILTLLTEHLPLLLKILESVIQRGSK